MKYSFVISFILVISATLFADTIVMKDGEKVKGLVVDEYVDRIMLSSINGEESILRENIERIEYDTPEQNFMQLGKAYDQKGWYDKASFYYKKAMEINPDYKEARLLYLASHEKMWRQDEKMTKKEIEHKNMVLNWWRDRNKKSVSIVKDKSLQLKKTLGFSLMQKDGIFTINEVKSGVSADNVGIQEGDILAGIWGKLIRYSKMQDVLNELLGPKYSEVRVLIEKDISVPIYPTGRDLYEEFGISLAFEYEGLIIKNIAAGSIAKSAGLKKGDFVMTIDGNISRYMPLDSIIALINRAKDNKSIVFTVRRNVNLRREGR